uniref:Uncharacterized protein n=1 Tax=Lygus hesperus TaxID=30085 RepID=A0A146M534_LYGHE
MIYRKNYVDAADHELVWEVRTQSESKPLMGTKIQLRRDTDLKVRQCHLTNRSTFVAMVMVVVVMMVVVVAVLYVVVDRDLFDGMMMDRVDFVGNVENHLVMFRVCLAQGNEGEAKGCK